MRPAFRCKMEASAAAPRGPGPDFAFKWSKELTAQFIKLRAENDSHFTGAKFSACTAWKKILEQLGLQGMVSSLQAKKKWDNLKKKYKDCKYPGTGEGDEGKSSAETWPWFGLMDEVLGPSIKPPVLGLGPSAGMGETSPAKEQGLEQEAPEGETRKRKRDDTLLMLFREHMGKQVIKHAPEGENTKDPNSWPWYFRMDDALRGRLQEAAKIMHDNEKKELDKPSTDSQDLISALNMVEMAPIEDEEDLFDKSVGGIKSKIQDNTVMPAPEVAVKGESVPSLPKIVQAKTLQNAVLYAALLPDSTASVVSKAPTTSSHSIVVQAKPANNISTATTVQPTTLLYATLLPDSTATANGIGKNCLASNRSLALEVAELNKRILEYKRDKKALTKEQSDFDKELINLEREREQVNKERQMLDLAQIGNERDRAMLDKSRADLEKERLLLERDRAFLDRDKAIFERDRIFLDKAKEDFERQKEMLANSPKNFEKGKSATKEEQVDVSEKCDNVTDKVLALLMGEGGQEETRHRFATLVENLSEKMLK